LALELDKRYKYKDKDKTIRRRELKDDGRKRVCASKGKLQIAIGLEVLTD
jgi:hypothetical protein